ncbi:Uma2 family endonuclease [Nocardia sp. NPDC060259]|uniref:Uma2 family endonuclease n=1 Tax=Nocardia sp. NPDC060259 TaxID=3347088 RepID=UPI003661DFBC
MPVPSEELPEFMTWDELELLPDEIAGQIELWGGRVVWVRRGPREHQKFTRRLTNEFERCARNDMSARPNRCWEVESETNVFLGTSGKSDFLTPDFLVHRCLPPFADVRSADTVLVGEVLSPSNTQTDLEAKKARYAGAGIPWYWEVGLRRDTSSIAHVRAYALETGHAELPQGVTPLRRANYLVVGEWTQTERAGITFDYPFRIDIPWSALAF